MPVRPINSLSGPICDERSESLASISKNHLSAMTKQTSRGVRRNKRGTYRISSIIRFRTIADVKRRLRRYKHAVEIGDVLPMGIMREVVQIFRWAGILPPSALESVLVQWVITLTAKAHEEHTGARIYIAISASFLLIRDRRGVAWVQRGCDSQAESLIFYADFEVIPDAICKKPRM